MSKLKVYTNKLTDFYNQEVDVGDLVLGATAGGRFHKTQFTHAIIVGRTKQMLEVHSIGPWANLDKAALLTSLEQRGHRGGRLNPTEVIRIESILSEAEITKAMEQAETSSYSSSFQVAPMPSRKKWTPSNPQSSNLFNP